MMETKKITITVPVFHWPKWLTILRWTCWFIAFGSGKLILGDGVAWWQYGLSAFVLLIGFDIMHPLWDEKKVDDGN